MKLAAELSRPDTGRTLYLLDEPTTGLHFDDLAKLLEVLNRLVDLGNTVVVIEHNLDVIKTADWVIDLGPEAGDEGGYLVAAGTPEDSWASRGGVGRTCAAAGKPLAPSANFASAVSHTGEVLAPVLAAGPLRRADGLRLRRRRGRPARRPRHRRDRPRRPTMPWQTDGRRWHTLARVGRTGNPCRWDGRILADVVDRIEQALEPLQPDRLELAERGRDPGGEEIGRLVLPRHHRRRMAAEDEVPHRPRHASSATSWSRGWT